MFRDQKVIVVMPAYNAGLTVRKTHEEVIAHCVERLARFKLPTAVERIDAIPRNPSGKILKVDLRKPYWKGRDRAVN